MSIKLPHGAITPIPNTRPAAIPALWNSRYAEADANFRRLAQFKAWAECVTDGADASKTAQCEALEVEVGASLCVFFKHTNTAENATLNVNENGAKPILFEGFPVQVGQIKANSAYTFSFNGENWLLTTGGSDIYGKGVFTAFKAFNDENGVTE